jgi:hypothetical protein
MPRRSGILIVGLSILAASAAARAQEGEGTATEYAGIVDIGGGTSELPIGIVQPTDNGGGKTFWFFGRNVSRSRFKDFELEMKGCGTGAKFHRVRVTPRAVFNDDGEMTDSDQRSDWDVDDDGSGLSDQQEVEDPGSEATIPGTQTRSGLSNETDDVDDSPGTKTRVDANGHSSAGAANERAEAAAGEAKTEDPSEDKPGDPPAPATEESARAKANGTAPPSEPLDGVGGIQPGDNFIIEFELTAVPKGKDCIFALVPSGAGGRQVALLQDGLRPGDNRLEFAYVPVTGGLATLPNATGMPLSAIDARPMTGMSLRQLSARSIDGSTQIGEQTCGGAPGESCRIAFTEPIPPDGALTLIARADRVGQTPGPYVIVLRPLEATGFNPSQDGSSGFLPSACPEGQSGGKLAGVINSLFGTDLTANCGEAAPRPSDNHKFGNGPSRDHGGD